jgi:hypothetical protein
MPGQTVVLRQWELDPAVPRPWSAIKRYWRYWRNPCARCGKPIDYEGYRFYWERQGGKWVRVSNQWALDVGHIVNRMDDPRVVEGRWDTGATYAPQETQPEHSYCNRRAGAIDGNRNRRRQGNARRRKQLRTSREW